ncbi:MAG: [FeFe] hydrogenase H-cluster maturation GTPase HydF [Phascolarctobacterium sp.]|nr:[FeFe] hydrogenase H-cluster maturation GTPase HydF [Phascolarctobacterium sp.]
MSLNATPSSERTHIGIFGRRNAGKSSLINALTSQNIAIVSEYKGTTTDPVYKAMELLPLGPVVIIDTPGIDDDGTLGNLRIEKAYQVLNKTDISILVIDGVIGIAPEDAALLKHIRSKNVPFVVVFNKSELLDAAKRTDLAGKLKKDHDLSCFFVSTVTGENIISLKESLARLVPSEQPKELVGDLLKPSNIVILVIPIDSAAPKGRLILPQQQVLRNILDNGAVAISVQETELAAAMAKLSQKPRLVITDSQAFEKVAATVPPDIPLTSFSILFARYKGTLAYSVRSVKALETIQDKEKILISEGCTHHRQCDDIGTVKLPAWIRNYTKKSPDFVFTSGGEFPHDLSPYKMIVHCGGCMLNEREMLYRNRCAADQCIPMTNYGIIIAYMNGILQRTLAPFEDIAALLK